MSADEATDVTGLLHAWRGGDSTAGEALFARIYGELKRIAAATSPTETARCEPQSTSPAPVTMARKKL